MKLATLKKMSATALFHCSLLLFALPLMAAPAKNAAEPVAEGYPAWTGITPKNYIKGRVLYSNAELRQRIAVVVEFDATKTAEQLEATGTMAELNGYNANVWLSPNWETLELPRDVMIIYVARNVKTHEAVVEGMKYKDSQKFLGLTAIAANAVPIYENVTFEGAPANGGKLPFVYVMGHEGKEPLLATAFTTIKATFPAVKKAVAEGKKKITEEGLTWRQFYGNVGEPKHFKDLAKTLAKGKPLDQVEAKLLKGVTSKDAETAKEAQMLYDGLAQTKSDLMWTAQSCFKSSPHVAAYKMGILFKYWPKTKKQMAEVVEKLKTNPNAQPLIKVYAKIVEWSNPDYVCKNASEAKKNVAELQKMKKMIEPLKEDAKNITIQNSALMLDGMLDELITVMPTKVPQK